MVEQINYEGAGTVEFIYENGKFFFLEMNTRVQVEHPVTEMQTGIDIVKEQLWIAFTGDTALKQSDINPRGHTIECRINAENPALDFQPSPGTISVCHQPSGFRTRVDGSIFQGCKITPYYDSLVAKVICKGRNRTEAIQRTLRSLDEFVLEGITTTIDLHKKILNHEKFLNLILTQTGWEKKNFIKHCYNSIIVNHKLHDQMDLDLGQMQSPSIKYKYLFVFNFSQIFYLHISNAIYFVINFNFATF